jgi:hypothetical protein
VFPGLCALPNGSTVNGGTLKLATEPECGATALNSRKENWDFVRYALTLPAARNYYFYGHQSGSNLGGTEDSDYNIPLDYLKENIKGSYRFVFLDGCNTGDAKWREAFKIPDHGDPAIYRRRRVPPGVFIGWAEKITQRRLKTEKFIPTCFAKIRTDFFARWADTLTSANNAMLYAKQNYDANHPNRLIEMEKYQLIGYKNLRCTQFNSKSEINTLFGIEN